ncbi:MAG: class I SAM-dependent methyltransferase [Patescibacteria group bacterium]
MASFRDAPLSPYWEKFFTPRRRVMYPRVLDLGCGGGRNTEMLIDRGYDVYACDKYPSMVRATAGRLVRRGYRRTAVVQRITHCTMSRLRYRTHFFDAVLSHGVYHNATSRREYSAALRESARIIRPGGFLCFNLFTADHISAGVRRVPTREDLYCTREGLRMVLVTSRTFFTLARSCGFRPYSRSVSYRSHVSTGFRWVLRGVLVKK